MRTAARSRSRTAAPAGGRRRARLARSRPHEQLADPGAADTTRAPVGPRQAAVRPGADVTAAKEGAASGLWRHLAQEGRACWRELVGLVALGALSVPLALLGPLPLKVAVDHALDARPLSGPLAGMASLFRLDSPAGILVLAAVLVVLIALLRQVVQLVENWLRTSVRETLSLAMRARLFRHAQRLSVTHHDRQGVADAAYRIQVDVPEAQGILVDAVPSLVSGATLVGMFWIAARMDFALALTGAAIAPGLLLTHRIFRRRFRKTWHEVKGYEASAQSVVQETLGALRVVKAFGQEDREQERFTGRLDRGMGARLELTWAEGLYGLQVTMLTAVGAAAVLWLGARHVQQGALTLGELLVLLTYMSQFYEPLKTMSRRAGKLQSRLASADRVHALLDRTPDVMDRPHARPLRRARGDLSVSGLELGYRPDALVLSDTSFEIPAGARVGISGTTGSGKTTLVSLLTRFFDPLAGEIRLDGVDLRDYRLADLRAQFSVVLQEPVLFATTVWENIAYARPGADRREIVEAARLAHADEFIRALPDGYDATLGERGLDLSGGERQRLSLARAFLRDAPILILDEPTSALDPRTEALVLEATERLMAGRTTVIIAHRSKLFERCDLRLGLDHGRVELWRPDAGAPARSVGSAAAGS